MVKTWGETNLPPSQDRRDIQRVTIEKGKSKTLRLVGDVLPRYVYWVTTTEGKRMPKECLGFNRETEKFDTTAKNPFDEISENIYGEKAQFAYVCNAIDRDDSVIKLFDLKRTIYSQVVEFAQHVDYGDPADVEKGYDITVKKEKTGPLPQNVKYGCLPRPVKEPLTSEERKNVEDNMYKLDEMFKRETYDEQKAWLINNTQYFAGVEGSELSPGTETAEDLK